MIIYSSNKSSFIEDTNILPDYLEKKILDALGEETSKNEKFSWINSLAYMKSLLDHPSIPDDAGIALEYNIPVTNNRIDFIITGVDGTNTSQVVIIELKQWSHVDKTDMDGVVRTKFEEGLKDTTHPSYQAFTYCMLLQDYKEAVQKHDVRLKAAAYLHNCENTDSLNDPFYEKYTQYVPVFGKNDTERLRDFICKYIRKGDRQNGLFVIENSTIRPSKNLMDSVSNMMKGNKEFRMIGEQKVILQHILKSLDDFDKTNQKQVLIIEGGPGTGKSVIAVNALTEVLAMKRLAMYVSKNAQPRNVFYRKLVDDGMGAKNVNALFKSSVAFADPINNQFDMLLVDEAHRLSKKCGPFSQSRNQIREIIHSAKVAVFFVDEAQIVSLDDIGSIKELTMWANAENAQISRFALQSQFRCSGSDEYLQWLDNLLEIKDSSFKYLSKSNYDFRIFDNPKKMMDEIVKRNQKNNKSRMVAGYCWEWKSQKNKKENDIVFPEYDFSYQWNFIEDKTWSISPKSVEQIGCIHTCQGLEFDYVGVIIGADIIYRDGRILVDPTKRASDDFTIRGYKTLMKNSPEETKELIKRIIKNTYRTLMSRGMKGCFVYVVDNELKEYIKTRLR
jgi:DUF2075 family protein